MISNRILQSSSTLGRICCHRFVIPLTRFGSTLSKETSSTAKKSPNKGNTKKSSSEYLADDMYNYNTFSYYEIEESMTKYRLPQPSAYAPLKPEAAAQKK